MDLFGLPHNLKKKLFKVKIKQIIFLYITFKLLTQFHINISTV